MKKTILILATALMLTTMASATFDDVPDTHWASTSINAMSDKGIVNGIGNNKYDPNGTVTYAQFATMLARSFYPSDIDTTSTSPWYKPYVDAMEKNAAMTGITFDANSPINRYEMAQLMYNVAKPSATASKVPADAIPANYTTAVNACYSADLLTGMDAAGTFKGESNMTRAQAAVVIDRLLKPAAEPSPANTSIPANATHITSTSQLSSSTGATCSGGSFTFGAASNGTAGDIVITTSGKSGMSFTVTAPASTGAQVRCHLINSADWRQKSACILGTVDPGTSKTFTINGLGTYKTGISTAEYDKEQWTRLGCDVTSEFGPSYVPAILSDLYVW